MSIEKCVVGLRDSRDAVHEVAVYAESLYAAVPRGLNRLVDAGWESDTDKTVRQAEVEIYQEPTRHIVNVRELLNWVKQDTMRPGEQPRKEKLGKLLPNAMISDKLSGCHSLIFRVYEVEQTRNCEWQ